MDEQKLNEKLAEWRGFLHCLDRNILFQPFGNSELGEKFDFEYWIEPGNLDKEPRECPFFTQSPNDCDKWLVPEVTKRGWRIETYTTEEDTAVTLKKVGQNDIFCCQPKFALAFCLAVEKLIDKETKD